jgi:hypothetical protein
MVAHGGHMTHNVPNHAGTPNHTNYTLTPPPSEVLVEGGDGGHIALGPLLS